jgi:hypothetical protein
LSDLHTAAMVIALILGWPGVIIIGSILFFLVVDFAFRMGKKSRGED